MLCSSSSLLAAVVLQMFCPHLAPVKPCYNAHETKKALNRTQEQKMVGQNWILETVFLQLC